MPIVKSKPSGHHMTKADAHYTDYAKSSREFCAKCSMFRKPHGCSLVKGAIAPGGWCKYYESK